MKTTLLSLLIAILLITIINALFNFGILGDSIKGSPNSSEYRVLNSSQMDIIGFKSLAELNGIKIDSSGTKGGKVASEDIRISFVENSIPMKIDFPKRFAADLTKTNLLPSTISRIEKEGWRFVAVSSDNHYIFRRQ